MPMNYVNYVKNWKASVEESCDVEFFCCMITRLPTPPLLRRLLWLGIITSSIIFARSSTLPTSVCSHCWKNTSVAHIFKWQWRHCVCGGLYSRARWTLLQDWYTKAAETMEQVHWSCQRLWKNKLVTVVVLCFFICEAGNFWNNPRKIKIKITVLQTISNQNHV